MERIALAVLLTLLAPTAASAQIAPEAARVLVEAKAAAGGAAWDRLTGSWERGTHGLVRYETSLDFRRLAFRFDNTVGGQVRVHAFDGEQVWDAAPGAPAKLSRDPPVVREVVTTAYVSANGHFFPERFPARIAWKPGVDPAFDVVEIEPAGGRAFELWFDRKSHLAARIVDRGPQPVTVELSDYRSVGDVKVAFRAVVKTPDGKVVDNGVVEAVEHREIPAAAFAPPQP